MSISAPSSDRLTEDRAVLSPVPWRPLLGVCAALVALFLVLAGRHGYYLDELYTRVAARHLDWGYIDQPPLVALVARAEILLFGDNLVGLRVAPALLAAVAVVLGALITRELGGDRATQLVAALTGAVTGLVLQSGHVLGTNNVDILVWVAICWLLIRLVRLRDPRLWVAIGAVVGVGLTAKYLVGLLLISLAAGLLICGPRRVLRSWYLPAGALLAVLIPIPVLVWQVLHGWPQLEMAAALSNALGSLGRVSFVPIHLLVMGLFATPIWVAGVVALLRRRQWRPYRFVAVAYGCVVALLLITAGQAGYVAPLQYVLLTAGTIVATEWARTRARRLLYGAAVAVSAMISAVAVLPVFPIQAYAHHPVLAGIGIVQLDQAGWPELAARTAAVLRTLPAQEQARAVLYGDHYGLAGALDKYGPEHGLPRAYSGHNSYADFGRPPEDKTVVIAIGVDRARFASSFASCRPHGTFTIDLPVSDLGQEFLVCRDPREPWSRLWPRLRWIGYQCPYTAKAVTARSAEGCD